jgi:hypothetical protein
MTGSTYGSNVITALGTSCRSLLVCLFPQKHTHPLLLAMVLEEVWFTRIVSPQQFSLQTFVFVVCGDRIGELVIYLKVQRETERSHKQLERDQAEMEVRVLVKYSDGKLTAFLRGIREASQERFDYQFLCGPTQCVVFAPELNLSLIWRIMVIDPRQAHMILYRHS